MHFLSFIPLKTWTLHNGCIMRKYLTFKRHFPLAMQYYLVPCVMQRLVRQTMQCVVILTRVDRHLGQSECLFIDYITKLFMG